MAQDLLLFVLFFDLMLIPFFFLIGTFGGENRIAATTKMIVYTLVGSLLMLVGRDRDGESSRRTRSASSASPSGPSTAPALHWQPGVDLLLLRGRLPGQDARLPDPRLDADAYRAAPLPVLILLSAVLSKVGAYGFLRVALPLFPQATTHFQELIMLSRWPRSSTGR